METSTNYIDNTATKSYKRVYVWEIPVRIFHWVNALAIVILSITGFIIGNPPAIMSQGEAWNNFTFGTVKTIHFISAYVFFGIMVLRIYWSFVGNQYAHWTAFVPWDSKFRANKIALHNIMHVIKYDLLLMKDKEHKLSDISIGHNYMATSAYVGMFFVALILVFTGFGLYSDLSEWWFPKLFSWVVPALGGDMLARLIHRGGMWLILVFIILHVYLALFHDWLHARGEISTMISGFKFVRTERVEYEEDKTGLEMDTGEGIGHEVEYEEKDEFKEDLDDETKTKKD